VNRGIIGQFKKQLAERMLGAAKGRIPAPLPPPPERLQGHETGQWCAGVNTLKPRQCWRWRKRKRPERSLTFMKWWDEEDRTPDLRIANATLSQLSYVPTMTEC
jgi:hypothetical protein